MRTVMSNPVFHVGGFDSCPYYQKAKAALTGVSILFPDVVKLGDGQHFATKEEYQTWLATFINEGGFPTPVTHTSSPIVWTETTTGTSTATPSRIYIGGCDATLIWCHRQLTSSNTSTVNPALDADLALDVESGGFGENATHGYDYDLVVIGGGSGGLAAAKEAAKLGNKEEEVVDCSCDQSTPQSFTHLATHLCVYSHLRILSNTISHTLSHILLQTGLL